MVIAASLAAPARAHSQVSVQVNIGQPPPVLVAQPVLVPVQASPVYYAPKYGGDVFFYDGRYYTVHNDEWFYATRVNTPWISVAVGKVPRAAGPGRTLPAGTGQERSLLSRGPRVRGRL